MRQAQADESKVYQIKVTLTGSSPPIWRRIQVRGSTTLGELHDILQVIMDWEDYHLHSFTAGGVEYSDPDQWSDGPEDELETRLDQVAKRARSRFFYEYDFGDGWVHELFVEKRLPPDPAVRYPIVLDGERAAPPEDSGGIWGYAELLEIIRDPEHPEHQDWLDFFGDEFDPELFDVDAANQALQQP